MYNLGQKTNAYKAVTQTQRPPTEDKLFLKSCMLCKQNLIKIQNT